MKGIDKPVPKALLKTLANWLKFTIEQSEFS